MRSEFGETTDASDDDSEWRSSGSAGDYSAHSSWDGVSGEPTPNGMDALRRAAGSLALSRTDQSCADNADLAGSEREDLDDRQRKLLDANFENAEMGLIGGWHSTEAYLAEGEDGAEAVYKPRSGEFSCGGRESIERGTFWQREAAAYEVSQLLRLDVVPATVLVDGPEGPGSLQEFVPHKARPVECYRTIDRQRVGVLDFIIGSTDRHGDNLRTFEDGRPAAIDNGMSFPADVRDSLRSLLIDDALNVEINADILYSVRKADDLAILDTLRRYQIPELAIDGVMCRLNEVRSGRIRTEHRGGSLVSTAWRATIRNW